MIIGIVTLIESLAKDLQHMVAMPSVAKVDTIHSPKRIRQVMLVRASRSRT